MKYKYLCIETFNTPPVGAVLLARSAPNLSLKMLETNYLEITNE